MTKPSVTTRPQDEYDKACVRLRGRQHQSQRALALLVGVVCVGAMGFAAARFFGPTTGAEPVTRAGTLSAAVVVMLLAAFLARRTAASVEAECRNKAWHRLKAEQSLEDPAIPAKSDPNGPEDKASGGTIICCSGGGIKSASFCMGALQQLKAKAGVWAKVDAVIGVSGGGYMASAWAVATHRMAAGSRTPDWSTDQLQSLRARTNYLASNGRVRFDLACSILFGVALNVVLLAGPLITLAWLVGAYAVDAGLASSAEVFSWANWWVLTPSLFLVLLAVTMFMSNRFGWGGGARSSGKLESGYWRLVAGKAAHHDDSERLRFFAEAPNTLCGWAVGYAIAVPVLIWAAQNYTHVGETFTLAGHLYDNRATISWGVGALAALIGLSHSGAKSTTMTTGPIGTAWRMLRQQIAPWVALLIIAGFGYWAVVLLTAREIRSPLTGGWAVGAAAAIVVLPSTVAMIGSANATSVFMFYRDRLAYAYLGPAWEKSGAAGSGTAAATSPAGLTLADVAAGDGRPELVLMATANAAGAGYLPVGRNGTPFILSDKVGYPGSTGTFPKATTAAKAYFLKREEPITVAEAMAISGAALSPQVGRESKQLGGYRLLMALANVRLGAWAPNPYFKDVKEVGSNRWRQTCLILNTFLNRQSALLVMQEAFGALRLDAPWVYLTDGGHYDNLGLVEALRRQPRLIYLLDGSGDAEDSFAAVGDAIATARMDLNVEVAFPDPGLLRRGAKEYPAQAWGSLSAKSLNGDGWGCEIVYIKAILPANFSFDLQAFQARNPGFPTELGRMEMLDEFDFEAYRQLGICATADALSGHRPGTY